MKKVTLLVAAMLAAIIGIVAPAQAEDAVPKTDQAACLPYYDWRDVERQNKTGFSGGRVMEITAAMQVRYECADGPDIPTDARAYNAVDCEVNGAAYNCSFTNQLRHYVDGIPFDQLNDSGTTGADGFWSRFSHWEPVGACNEYESRAETWNAGLASQHSDGHFWTWSFNADGSPWSYCPTLSAPARAPPAAAAASAPNPIVTQPTPMATRLLWTACGNNLFRQVGPNDSRIMKFQSCLRLHQVQRVDGGYRTDYVTAHGDLQCKVNVPSRWGDNTDIAIRFQHGTPHACSVRSVVGTNFVNASLPESPGDGDDSTPWTITSTGSDGAWHRCVGNSCTTINSHWGVCTGFADAWRSRFDWIDVGLDNYRRDGVVAQSRSTPDYLC